MLAPALSAIRQQQFYAKPRFHASIAWMLVTSPTDDKLSGTVSDIRPIAKVAALLNTEYALQLSTKSVGSFVVPELNVKIGKEVTSWALKG